MKRIPFFALLVAAALPLAVPMAAQVPAAQDLLAAKAKDIVNINLDSSMLRLATSFLSKQNNDEGESPGLKKLILGLKNISVKKYTFAEEGQYKTEDLQPVGDQLRASGWGMFLGLHGDKGGSTDIYTKSVDGQIAGIGVVKAEPKEVTVVSIEGAIDLSGLADLAGKFGIPALGLPGQNPDQKKKAKGPQ